MNYDSIKKRIRSITKVPRSNDRRCYITRGKNIESHHLYRVADLSKICVDNKYFDIKSLYIPLIDLNHIDHFIWHVLAEDSCGHIEITADKIDKYYDLMNEMQPLCDKVPEILQDDYIDLHTRLCDTIERNIELNQSKSITEEMKVKEMFDNDIFWGANRIPPENEEIVSMNQIYLKYEDFDMAI